jgi:hypothetical protein
VRVDRRFACSSTQVDWLAAGVARYWDFTPRACGYWARTKGKDERCVGYVKRNALACHSFATWRRWRRLRAGLLRGSRTCAGTARPRRRRAGFGMQHHRARHQQLQRAVAADGPTQLPGQAREHADHADRCNLGGPDLDVATGLGLDVA